MLQSDSHLAVLELLKSSVHLPYHVAGTVVFRGADSNTRMPISELNQIDARLLALIEYAQSKRLNIKSLVSTWDLWHGNGAAKRATDINNDNLVYLGELTRCFPKDVYFVVGGDGFRLEKVSAGVWYATEACTIEARVGMSWIESSHPECAKKIITAEALGLSPAQLSDYVCSAKGEVQESELPHNITL